LCLSCSFVFRSSARFLRLCVRPVLFRTPVVVVPALVPLPALGCSRSFLPFLFVFFASVSPSASFVFLASARWVCLPCPLVCLRLAFSLLFPLSPSLSVAPVLLFCSLLPARSLLSALRPPPLVLPSLLCCAVFTGSCCSIVLPSSCFRLVLSRPFSCAACPSVTFSAPASPLSSYYLFPRGLSPGCLFRFPTFFLAPFLPRLLPHIFSHLSSRIFMTPLFPPPRVFFPCVSRGSFPF